MRAKTLRLIAPVILVALILLIPGISRLGQTPAPSIPDATDKSAAAAGSAPPTTAPGASVAPAPASDDASPEQAYSEACCPLCGPERDLVPSDPPLRGEDVGELQDRLERLGYYKGPQDWLYDGDVVAAVRAFQLDNGLEDDGVVDDVVWNALDDRHETAFLTLAKPTGSPLIVIDIDKHRLSLYFDQTLFATFPVAVGKPDTPTPIGEWHIADKDRDWGTGFGSRFMKLDVPWGIYGIHGTNKPWSIGQAMSGGCIRMLDRHVEKIFDLVSVGTPVRIIGTLEVRRLCRGDRGSDVMEVQAALAEAGFFKAEIDGFFGGETEKAVLSFQRAHGLQPNGQVDKATYNELGM